MPPGPDDLPPAAVADRFRLDAPAEVLAGLMPEEPETTGLLALIRPHRAARRVD
ncbi:hypothetical protein [Nonomuraea zeae]|uniref:hypothetical protein n=1 Tax=Nonomuraea zeae TaxID=1642303 RepID=UPI0014796296|nr:hypothetical protein [Nonomuraea zeae]